MLLLHDSGLPDHREFFKDTQGPRQRCSRACSPNRWSTSRAQQIVYSDLGFILLGEIVERLTGESLDVFAQREIFDVLGMDRSMFNPSRKLREDIAPTEKDTASANADLGRSA